MGKFIFTGAALFCYHVALAFAQGDNDGRRPVAAIDTGLLTGITTSDPSLKCKVNKFLGIPFAKPPIRWELAVKPEPWQGTRDASQFGNACHQRLPSDEYDELLDSYFNPPAPVPDSEDCLYLNVYAPVSTHLPRQQSMGTGKPVMFWIHGGSDAKGTAALPIYNATGLAGNQDVIVVTTNYRLNVFGFPGSPDLPKAVQNFGLHDQRLALDWVQRNIHAFGGDPKRVTIFGESAGGRSVNNLVTAPPNPVPFAAAIIESGALQFNLGSGDTAAAWRSLVAEANCSAAAEELECMRQVPALTLKNLTAKKDLTFAPFADGGVTYANDMRAQRLGSILNKNAVARVPLLVGSNANEASLFLHGRSLDEVFAEFLGKTTADLFLALYRPFYKGFPSPEARDEALGTEFLFTCTTSLLASDSSLVKIPTWRYFFNASFPNTEFFPGSGAYHSAEIRPIFGTNPSDGATPFQVESSKMIQKAWADFAKNPNAGPGWDKATLVEILGCGATPGESDIGRRTSLTVKASKVDNRCLIYAPIYTAVTATGLLRDAVDLVLGDLLGGGLDDILGDQPLSLDLF